MDVEGTVIVRDLRSQDILSTIKLDQSYESGLVLFNQKMKNEIFVFINNELCIYHVDGTLIQKRELDFNIAKAE